jgi:hypothetical protein
VTASAEAAGARTRAMHIRGAISDVRITRD